MFSSEFILGLPQNVFYLVALLIIITVLFVWLKRPIYEAMFIGYVSTAVMTGRYDLFVKDLIRPSTSSLFYAIVAFLLLAQIFGETKVVDKVINIILAVVGRFRVGAGYVSLVASTFMASLSGTGPGNVAATGVCTIPTMIKTKFPKPLAATVEMSASSLGPMIPPSGTILLVFGVLDAFLPESQKIPLSTFWMVVWGIGIWFILQRFLTLLGFCYYYKVEPMSPEDLPSIKESLKKGWPALIIPLIIFVPLFIDAKFSELILNRVGADGAKAFSKTILMFTPGLAFLYALYLGRQQIEGGFKISSIFNMLKKSYSGIVPVAATVYFAYAIAYMYQDVGMTETVSNWILGFGMSKGAIIIFIPVFTAFLGMVLPGSSQIAIFGATFLTIFAAVGINPILGAAMLPAITGSLEGMTPPLALSMYAAMGISGSKFVETSKLAFIWVGIHLAVSLLVFAGLLPVFGL
ncbi:MAG: TRAP transporter permease [Clostridia bacterium]|nr:TRAP transporter permease [Clostridia bacterium]